MPNCHEIDAVGLRLRLRRDGFAPHHSPVLLFQEGRSSSQLLN